MNVIKKTEKLIRGLIMILLIGSTAVIFSCERNDEPLPPDPRPANYNIKGEVIDQQTKQPLAGVEVKMGTLSATTNASGVFQFTNLTQAGKYNLTFSKANYFEASYSLEFEAALANQTMLYSITVAMVPYVPGVTPLDPVVGGTISIDGATLTLPAGTSVKDKNGQDVGGIVNLTFVSTPNIIAGDLNNAAIGAYRFEPSGYQFNPALPLVVDNPLENARFSQVQLEFFNEGQNKWVVEAEPVVYNSSNNKYSTKIHHFSLYKISYVALRSALGASTADITVIDSPIENNTLVPMDVTTIKVENKKGYKFATPAETVIQDAGITGDDVSTLKSFIISMVSPYFGNTEPVSELETVEEDITVDRVVQPNYKLVTTGGQAIGSYSFTVNVTLDNGDVKALVFNIHAAESTVLIFEDIYLDDHTHGHGHGHNHGLGGGGSR